MALKQNIKAPNFSAYNDRNEVVTLSDYLGKWIILYFYPKDNTSGCTKEACSFQENLENLTKHNAIVLGVSPDSVKSHINFKQKYSLEFSLIADQDKVICNLYDVMGEKSMYGRKYLGVIRTTYIINPKGEIVWVNPKVAVDGHTEEVINVLKSLKDKQ
jgi:peroxiredoxin Q/BCP